MPDIIPIPAFNDNYIWAIRNDQHAAFVDPGDAGPVIDYLARERIEPVAILLTHHHGDHVGGCAELARHFSIPAFGPKHESIGCVTHPVAEGMTLSLPQLAIALEVLDIPGHTAGHVGYFGQNSLFCGDTLFGCGCGRLFEGTAQQLYQSLQKLARLPEKTQVYAAHEYTLANIRFAKCIEPENRALAARENDCLKRREAGLPTLPSSIELEKATNPFLRCGNPAVARAVEAHCGRALDDAAQVFAELRQWRNRF